MSEYIQRAERIIQYAGERLDRRKGECRDCKWSSLGFMGRTCVNPIVILASETVDQGYGRDRLVECDQQRRRSSVWGPVVCGPDGDLYEDGFSISSFFKRLFA